MLVAALMDIITSDCDNSDLNTFHPLLPGNASSRDIASAIAVIEQGGMQFDDHSNSSNNDDSDDDGDIGMKGIGIKVLGGTTVLGFSKLSGKSDFGTEQLVLYNLAAKPVIAEKLRLDSSTVPGLWDDLQREHVAVPFATWALANWALASGQNRAKIQDLDRDGFALTSALNAPERTVKWHGSLIARALLTDPDLELSDSVTDWSSSLLSTAFHASENKDLSLAQLALSAFLVSVEKSDVSRVAVRKIGLHLLRNIVKNTEKNANIQESVARVLGLLYGNVNFSIEEGRRWSGILLRWIFDKCHSDATRILAIKIVSRVLEDCGPHSIPVSQGWLTLLLDEVLGSSKTENSRGNAPSQADKAKNQIDHHNASSATQIASQLASAVVRLAGSHSESDLSDFLSLEPFYSALKASSKQKNPPKFDAADSAQATLRATKAISELCSEDPKLQQKITDLGAVPLLCRFLLGDDYEKLAANETYDASNKNATHGDDSPNSADPPAGIRIPPAAHIRRHAARLLTILSTLPTTKNSIKTDSILCEWLESRANGLVQCNDLKLQSYCRSVLLNIHCPDDMERNCLQFGDGLFFLNPELPLATHFDQANVNDRNAPVTPSVDVVFVHGLRGGPFNSWRIADCKSSNTNWPVESIDQESGKEGTCWPREWLALDFPDGRYFTVKYKTNLTQWTGASLPLQEVSSMLLRRLLAAGIGSRPVVFVTHSMGGLVIKQMLHQAKLNNFDDFFGNTKGIVFYSCPHFGSKLADMPWRMGYVLRPAPSIGELRSDSPRLVELNDFVRSLYNKGSLDVLSFSETLVTPIVEGYGGWAFRAEIVPIESAYPGYGELVVLDSTDHVNSCKPLNKTDPSYAETLEFLKKLKKRLNE